MLFFTIQLFSKFVTADGGEGHPPPCARRTRQLQAAETRINLWDAPRGEWRPGHATLGFVNPKSCGGYSALLPRMLCTASSSCWDGSGMRGPQTRRSPSMGFLEGNLRSAACLLVSSCSCIVAPNKNGDTFYSVPATEEPTDGRYMGPAKAPKLVIADYPLRACAQFTAPAPTVRKPDA
jgi:hypothetical protein